MELITTKIGRIDSQLKLDFAILISLTILPRASLYQNALLRTFGPKT